MTAIALSFHDVQFDIIDRNSQPWLRGHQISDALGYSDESSITRIYARNADEFTDSMTCSVKLTEQAGQMREVRIFSLRGCHLLAMFARTKIAKEFRKWVLDVLDRETVTPHPRPDRTRKALPGGLTIEQQDAVKALIKSRVEILPHDRQAKAAITCWSSIKSKFGVSYKAVPAEQFTEVLSLVARLPLEEELLKADDPCRNPPLPFLQGKMGERFLIRLDGGGRYSVIPLGITEIVIDLSDLVAIDQALDTWRDFAKRKELRYYRAGMANLQNNDH